MASVGSVGTAFEKMLQTGDGVMQNVDEWLDSVKWIIQQSADMGDREQATTACSHFRKLLEVQAQGLAYRKALVHLSQSYTMGDDRTDFDALLAEEVQKIQSNRVEPAETDEYKDIVRDMERRLAGGDLLEDEDMRIDETQDALAGLPNSVCPISLRNVLELENPVQDEHGFIYEREVVEDYIKTKSRQEARVPCPVAGTNHAITVAGLQPASAAIRGQRQVRGRRRRSLEEEDIL